MDVPTIAQVKAESPESLGHFLMNLPATMEAQLFYALMLTGILGMFANYGVKWAKGEIGACLATYLFRQHLRLTVLSFLTYSGTAMAAIYADAFHVGDQSVFVGWGMVMWLGALNGYSIDSMVNKGQRPVWTGAQRKEASK
jgi:hypothetical protein